MSIRRLSSYAFLVFLAVAVVWIAAGSRLSSQAMPQTPTVISGRNVNMVSGMTLPGGDPWLQRQNEPSIAVSSRNPLHLLAGANDYRTVDMPTSEGELPGKQPTAAVGDAWLGVFMSYDGGESWTSTMLPGFPQDSGNNPLKGYRAAADPVVRSGPNGLFYFSGIAFNRGTNLGVVFVARFIDDNNKENGGTIRYIDTKIIAKGTATKFLDKPWISVDQPRAPLTNIMISGQTFPRHNVYIAYSSFSGTTTLLGDIMFARSTDCGTSWGNPIKLSTGSYAQQGATIAVKPVIGEVLVAWRRFGVSGRTPDTIYVAQSFSRGAAFQSPVKVADVTPFDQPTTDETQALPGTAAGPAFRTNSYPTIAVDKSGHVYLAWSQRGQGPSGDARIVLSASYLGTSWSVPQPVANVDENGLPLLGHQIMPSMTFAAGKLALVWVDQRHDISALQYGFNKWIIDSLFSAPYLNLRHTMDVWAAEAETSTFPNLVWKSSQVSRYLHALLRDQFGEIVYQNGLPVVFPVQFNCVNYPLFKGGHNPFNGDYIDIAASPSFRQDTWRNWIFNTDDQRDPVFHVAWADNRDVRPPLNGNWTVYTPPASSQASAYVSPEHPSCNPNGSGNEPGMRNQNIYTSRLTWGVVAGAPVNDKPLNLANGVARAFVVYVQNNTETLRHFRLSIAAQPASGQASFDQFRLLSSLDVDIAPYSTISRTVFIRSSDANAPVTVNVSEIDASGAILADGLKSFVDINRDTSNPQMTGNQETHNPNIVNSANPNIVNWFINPNIVNPNIVNPNIVNPNIVNPNIVNPNIVNPNIVNPNIVNPNIVNPNIVNPNIVNPNIVNPNIVNPNIVNPNIVNPNIVNANPDDVTATDVEWTVKNEGTATTSYSLKTLAKKSPPQGVYVQLLVYRVHYTPAVTGAELKAEGVEACSLKQEPHHELVLNVVNPNIVNPNIVNPNIVNPNIVNADIENATFSVAPGEEVVVDLRVLDSGTSNVASSPQMAIGAMAAGVSAQAVTVDEFIQSLGFAVTSHAVNSVDVALGSQVPPADATDLVIGTASLPDGVVGYSYNAPLNAYGGAGSYAWSLNAGELPPGLSVAAGGAIVGTPTQAGTYQFIVRVDSGGQFDTQQYAVNIDSNTTPDPLNITTTSIPSGVQGVWYGATLQAVGGVWPRSWRLSSGALPEGVSLDSGGVISGTPTVTGSFGFTARVADRNGTIDTQTLTLVVAPETATYFDITGVVFNEGGAPLGGVVLRGLPNTPVTAADGTYADKVPAGWSGTAIPFAAGHTFSPASRTYTNLASSQSSQNYNTGSATLSIFGTVELYGSGPLAGVVMTGLPGNPTTDTSGNCLVTVPYGWSGTVTPVLSGYSFVPPSKSFTDITTGQTALFTAALVVGPANRLAFTQQPGGGIGGTSWAVLPKVEIQDASGNRIHGDNSTQVTLAIGANPGSGFLSGSLTATVVDGEATFAGLSIDRGGFAYTLIASTVAPVTLMPATSAGFDIEGFSDRASMSEPRQFHTATFLFTDKILIAGGGDAEGAPLDSAELYDPEDDTFIGLPSMSDFRGGHTATTLLDGKVLIVGGSATASADIFDPATGTFTEAAGTTYARTSHAASLLQDSRVLVTGGSSGFGDTAEIYDTATGLWSPTGTMHESRASHASTWLPNGMVLITGGGVYVTSAELFDPSSGTFTSIGDMAGGPRYGHTSTLLNDGTVLITGGTNYSGDLSTAEIFDPAAGTFEVTGTMHGAHSGHHAVLLRDGKVLIVGDGEPEIYDPSTGEFRLTGPAYIAGSQRNAATAINDGRVFVTGGYGEGVMPYTEMWNPLHRFPTHVISGHVRHLGVGLPGVLMAGFPAFPITDSGGYYEAVVIDGWSGTAAPTKPGYTFGPASTVYPPIGGDLTLQDYEVLTVPTFTISGSVRANALPLEGVVMNGLPGNPLTDATGHYTATVSETWTGTATPAKEGHTFMPPIRNYTTPLTADLTSEDYSATALTYSISGTVTAGGSPLANVIMNGLPGDPTTNAQGTYTATVDYGSTTTVTPTLAGYTFTPPNFIHTSVTSNVTQDYTAVLLTYTISGTVTAGGSPLANVVMSGLPGSPLTNTSGVYTAYVYYGWDGTVTPTLAGYAFTPPSQTYTDVVISQVSSYAAMALESIAFTSHRDGNYEIYIMKADGSGQTRLTNDPAADSYPVFSPDGSKIAFMSLRDGNYEIYIMNADGSGQTRVTNNLASETFPCFSPDGSKIAFSSDRDGNEEIYIMNADGSGQTRLTNNPGNDEGPIFSPDASKIAFANNQDTWDIYVMNADGSGQVRLTNNSGAAFDPCFSPDGSKIAFTSSQSGYSNWDILVMNTDGSGQTPLTFNPAYDGKPSFSPDGSKIAFYSTRDGNYEIYIMNADGSDQTRLTNNPADDLAACFRQAKRSETYEFVAKWGTQGAADGQFNYPMGIAVDSSGNVYVVDRYNDRIQKFDSSGTFLAKLGGSGSGDGQFLDPFDVAVDSSGFVYATDISPDRVQKFNSDGTFLTKWGTLGTEDGQFDNPWGIAVDSSGYVYVADTQNSRIQKFNSDGTFLTKWGTLGTEDGQFYHPVGIAVDSSGHVYVSDQSNQRIQKFTSDGTFMTKWGSGGNGDGQFYNPWGIAVDSSGYVYVVDELHHRIQKFTSDGTFVTKWGTLGTEDGQFNTPDGIAVDGSGNVYVADWQNYRIQKFRKK